MSEIKYEIGGLPVDFSASDDDVRIMSPFPMPTSRVESFTVILNDDRAVPIRSIGEGGTCQMSGLVAGDEVEPSSYRIEAMEDTPEGGIKAHFVWVPRP